MSQTRVVAINLSRFRADVVRRALARPDISLIESVDEQTFISGNETIDVVIVGAEGERLPAICGVLLYAMPRIRILVIEEQGGDAALYELQPHKMPLGNVTEEQLADAIRGRVAGGVA